MSLGPRRWRLRQRAISHISAVESGPPDTASTSAGWSIRSVKRTSASASSTAAVDTLLFALDRRLHVLRGTGKFLGHLGERHAGEIALLERGERLAEPQQRIGLLGAGRIFLRHRHERLGGRLIVLALKEAFAQPELRLA